MDWKKLEVWPGLLHGLRIYDWDGTWMLLYGWHIVVSLLACVARLCPWDGGALYGLTE